MITKYKLNFEYHVMRNIKYTTLRFTFRSTNVCTPGCRRADSIDTLT